MDHGHNPQAGESFQLASVASAVELNEWAEFILTPISSITLFSPIEIAPHTLPWLVFELNAIVIDFSSCLLLTVLIHPEYTHSIWIKRLEIHYKKNDERCGRHGNETNEALGENNKAWVILFSIQI